MSKRLTVGVLEEPTRVERRALTEGCCLHTCVPLNDLEMLACREARKVMCGRATSGDELTRCGDTDACSIVDCERADTI